MTDKIILNIVYSPQTDNQHKVFENEDGEVWNSKDRDPNKINIGMGWYSIREPKKGSGDCLLVVEPYCVLDRDYDVKFADKFDKVFTWASKAFDNPRIQNKIIEINHPSYHNYPSAEETSRDWVDWKDRKNEIVFIANNKTSQHYTELYSLRIQLADMLHAKSDYEVSWYGQIPLKRPYYKGKVGDKTDVLNKVKFSVCTENSYDEKYSKNYFSEKLPDVWKSGAMPLYMGCYNIDDLGFFEGSYVDLRKFIKKDQRNFLINEDGLLNHLKSITENDHKTWCDRIKNEIIDSDSFRKQILFKSTYETMIKSFKK